MAEQVYLTVDEVLQIHHELIETYGGAHGLRGKGLLESAVFRTADRVLHHYRRGSSRADGIVSQQSSLPRRQ